jgi:hypothetical protein
MTANQELKLVGQHVSNFMGTKIIADESCAFVLQVNYFEGAVDPFLLLLHQLYRKS